MGQWGSRVWMAEGFTGSAMYGSCQLTPTPSRAVCIAAVLWACASPCPTLSCQCSTTAAILLPADTCTNKHKWLTYSLQSGKYSYCTAGLLTHRLDWTLNRTKICHPCSSFSYMVLKSPVFCKEPTHSIHNWPSFANAYKNKPKFITEFTLLLSLCRLSVIQVM